MTSEPSEQRKLVEEGEGEEEEEEEEEEKEEEEDEEPLFEGEEDGMFWWGKLSSE